MRVIIGGDGIWMGLAIIVSSGAIGLLWRQFRPTWRQKNTYLELFALGFVVHLVMFGCTTLLPNADISLTRNTIILPLILIYTPVTMLLGLLMLRQSNNYQNSLAKSQDIIERKRMEVELKNSLSIMKTTLDSIRIGILVVDHTGKIITSNTRFAQMWNIPANMITLGDDRILLNYIPEQLEDPLTFIETVTDLYKNPDAESLDLIYFKDGRIFERLSKPLNLEDQTKRACLVIPRHHRSHAGDRKVRGKRKEVPEYL